MPPVERHVPNASKGMIVSKNTTNTQGDTVEPRAENCPISSENMDADSGITSSGIKIEESSILRP